MAAPVAEPPQTIAGEGGQEQGQERRRAAYTRVAVAGLLLAASAPALGLAAVLVAGMPLGEEGVFFGVMIVVPLLGAGLAWRFGAWAKVLAAVLSLGMGLMLHWMAFGLSYPASFADFVPGVLLPLGVVLGLGGSVAALVAHRRGHHDTAATRGERRALGVALAIAGLAVIGSGMASVLAHDSVEAAADAVPVTISEFAFAEGSYEVAAGEPTSMLVHNSDAFVHTFTIPELGIDETVLPGSDVLVDVTAEPGTYTLYCRPHSNLDEPDPAEAGMAGTVIAR
ncbi:MAG TPA: cupredoxin domain-containing protein [Egibacteraceae bacterium]|nr:cupredoxin domain-containing protein [Egibacteraceae bacterium]